MSRILVILLVSISFVGCSDSQKNSFKNKPLETWGIKTSDYNKIFDYFKNDSNYRDVSKPICSSDLNSGLKILCAREDFVNLAWLSEVLSIYAAENATGQTMNHKDIQYKIDCDDVDCVGGLLKKNFYGGVEFSGMGYLLNQ